MFMLYHRLEVGREVYVKSIVEAYRIRYKATAPESPNVLRKHVLARRHGIQS